MFIEKHIHTEIYTGMFIEKHIHTEIYTGMFIEKHIPGCRAVCAAGQG
jgi:hypothetical protein